MNTFLTRRWLKNLPVAVFVVGGGIAIAQSQTGEAVFPYVGYLEENGFAVTGERTVRVDLFATANATEAPCRSQTFSPVDLHAGRFQVEVTVPRAGGVYDACLAGGELFAGIAVGAADAAAGDLVALTSGVGGDRVRIGSVPFAAASPKAVPLLVADSVQVNGDVLADGTVSANALSANSAAINGALTANSARVTGALNAGSAAVTGALTAASAVLSGGLTAATATLQAPVGTSASAALLSVRSPDANERLRVEQNGVTIFGKAVPVAEETGLRIVRGTVNSSGVVTSGAGFTASRLGTATIRFTFNNAFSGVPSVVVTQAPGGASTDAVTVAAVSATEFTTLSGVRNIGFFDNPISFIAIGPR